MQNPQDENFYVLEDMPAQELDQLDHNDLMTEVQQKFTHAEIKWVTKVHAQLGHPSSTAPAAALQEMHADD